MIILDTNVLSELAKPNPEAAVVEWMDAQPATLLYTTAITEAEILFGLAAMPVGRRQTMLKQLTETMFSAFFVGRVWPFDRNAAQAFAVLAATIHRAGRAPGRADLQIAAIARARSAAAIATRNIRDFAGCGVDLVNPWEA